MKSCNPLLRSWARFLKESATFVVLRKYGAGHLGSERRVIKTKKKARR